jgi:hypothetical protein
MVSKNIVFSNGTDRNHLEVGREIRNDSANSWFSGNTL